MGLFTGQMPQFFAELEALPRASDKAQRQLEDYIASINSLCMPKEAKSFSNHKTNLFRQKYAPKARRQIDGRRPAAL
jgi:hypothetical protein